MRFLRLSGVRRAADGCPVNLANLKGCLRAAQHHVLRTCNRGTDIYKNFSITLFTCVRGSLKSAFFALFS